MSDEQGLVQIENDMVLSWANLDLNFGMLSRSNHASSGLELPSHCVFLFLLQVRYGQEKERPMPKYKRALIK